MLILCANVGSTSFKYRIIDVQTSQTLVKGVVERIGHSPSPFTHAVPGKAAVHGTIDAADHNAAIAHSINLMIHPNQGAIRNLNALAGIGFKTVFAKGIWRSALITNQVIKALEAYIPLVPLHNSAYIDSIRAFQELAPNTPLVAVLETWFHQTIPDYAYEFGVPRTWVEKYQVRRYGFHGASHRYIAERVPQILDAPTDGCAQAQKSEYRRIVSCHLGGSSSLCAIRDGKSIDTTMGISTQCGLIQSTRSGDFDPFAMLYVMEEEGWNAAEIRRQLINESGLLGISGVSGDVRDIEAAASAGNDYARLALETFYYGVKKYIGAYIAALGGVDVIAFTGGIGEKSPEARRKICDGLQWQGISLDQKKNENHAGEGELSTPDSRAKILVIPANEEIIVARESAQVIRQEQSDG